MVSDLIDPNSAPDNKIDSLSVIMAAYKEEENLKILLPQLKSVLCSITPNFEVIVVDTITPMDQTEKVCLENGVTWLQRKGGNNYGDAIRTGIKSSSGKYVVVMDADGSHNPDFICRMWEQRKGADIVIASRYVKGGKTNNPWILVTFSRILNIIFKSIVQFPVMDVSNSFRLYNGEKLRGLSLSYQHFDVLEEILAKLLWGKQGPVKVKEIPFSFEQRFSGKSKRNLFVFGWHFLLAIQRLRGMRKDFQ